MATKLAALIHFRADVPESLARAAIDSIADVLEVPKDFDFVDGKMVVTEGDARDYVREYDDEFGGPVWYIP